MTYDCAIIGGGVIGLSLAWEMAGRGMRVCVVDRRQMGKGASWAGAGMIPPGASSPFATPLERLTAFSSELHENWAERLSELTGIDTEYSRCGAIYVALTGAEALQLRDQAERWCMLGTGCESLTAADLKQTVPALNRTPLTGTACGGDKEVVAYRLPAEAQVRNPRHLTALQKACELAGVTLMPHSHVGRWKHCGDNLESIECPGKSIHAKRYCIAAGSWSGGLAETLGLPNCVRPVRGQILLLKSSRTVLNEIVNHGPRYLVPRRDGRLLVGSTMEQVGFDTSTTTSAISDLHQFAIQLVPCMADATVETAWAGLRPASDTGLPIIGQLPRWKNVFMASGHFRAGITLSPATAVLLTDMITGQTPALSLDPFAPEHLFSVAG